MRRVSKRRASENRTYAKRRLIFLEKHENRICPVVESGVTGRPIGTTVYTQDVHHTNHREGKLLLDERFWLAVSREGHRWIGDHPAEARKRGWLI